MTTSTSLKYKYIIQFLTKRFFSCWLWADLLWSRWSQFHDANSVVGSAPLFIELNVTGQSIDTNL